MPRDHASGRWYNGTWKEASSHRKPRGTSCWWRAGWGLTCETPPSGAPVWQWCPDKLPAHLRWHRANTVITGAGSFNNWSFITHECLICKPSPSTRETVFDCEQRAEEVSWFTLSHTSQIQSHRTVWVGKDIKVHLVPAFCFGHGHLPQDQGAPGLFLNASYWPAHCKICFIFLLNINCCICGVILQDFKIQRKTMCLLCFKKSY